MGVAIGVVIVLVILGVIFIAASIRVLREYERGVIFRLGRLHSPPKRSHRRRCI